jgi:hypothetical protein
MTATWVLDGVTFYGDDVGGGKFIVETMDGINDAPSLRTDAVPRVMQDGDFDTPVTRGPRLVTAAGWCEAATEAGLLSLRNQFTGILADGESALFVINEFDTTRSLKGVRLYGEQRFRRRGGLLYADWSFMIRAVNPRIYDNATGTGTGRW